MKTRSWPSLGVTWARHKSYATTSSCVTSSAPSFLLFFSYFTLYPDLPPFLPSFSPFIMQTDGSFPRDSLTPWLPSSNTLCTNFPTKCHFCLKIQACSSRVFFCIFGLCVTKEEGGEETPPCNETGSVRNPGLESRRLLVFSKWKCSFFYS